MTASEPQAQTAASPPPPAPPPAGFWETKHLLIGAGVLVAFTLLLLRACGDDESEQRADSADDTPRQAIVVQIPASQWNQPAQQLPPVEQLQQQPVYAPPLQQSSPQAIDGGNPWAVRKRSYSGGNAGSRQPRQQWGQSQRGQSRQYQPSGGGAQYRPLQSEKQTKQRAAPPVQAPVQGYWPNAPYDRLSGSSFGEQGYYPYGAGTYPGYYGATPYGTPGLYAPGWPVGTPGGMWPGYR